MDAKVKKKLFVVDLSVKKTSPAGSCVLSELVGLSEEYDIRLISSEVDDQVKEFVTLHELSTPKFLLVLRYIVFSIKVKSKVKNLLKQLDFKPIIQTTQGQYGNSTISYPHFCHRAYLKKYWKSSTVTGLKRFTRKLNHLYNARMEARAFRNVKVIVVPSEGLKRELLEFYPDCKDKVKIIANPVDVAHFDKPADFDRARLRSSLKIKEDEIVIAFVALGDFARKGLPELMRSLTDTRTENENFKILVIGGKQEEIGTYQKMSVELGIENKVLFVGFKNEIQPFLWASDLFSLPSIYEIFPLVCLQAAAAGLPLLTTKLHGVEEFLEHGKNGWSVGRNAKAIANILNGIVKKKYDLDEMGLNAKVSVRKYDHENFREKWKSIYRNLESGIEVIREEV